MNVQKPQEGCLIKALMGATKVTKAKEEMSGQDLKYSELRKPTREAVSQIASPTVSRE
jgi:hypothetical protein